MTSIITYRRRGLLHGYMQKWRSKRLAVRQYQLKMKWLEGVYAMIIKCMMHN